MWKVEAVEAETKQLEPKRRAYSVVHYMGIGTKIETKLKRKKQKTCRQNKLLMSSEATTEHHIQ